MSASLILLIPVVLLGLVTVLCFTGCVLSSHGQAEFGPYQDGILTTRNPVAFWPLDDQPSPDVSQPEAVDIAPKQPPLLNPFTGFYMGPAGSFTLGQTGIVPGDMNNGLLTPCAVFNGGFVSVGFEQALNPTTFTLEAWVNPAAVTPGVQSVVVACANVDQSPTPIANAGYALAMTQDGVWAAQIGIGQTFFPLPSTDPIVAGVPTYLAMTFDGTNLKLFVGIVGSGTFTPFSAPAPAGFLPEGPATATSLFIGMGRPDTGGMFPFNGSIQDVAFYSPPLSDTDVQNNFNLGRQPPG
jgi:Concanavalin A-like lectin/glucanases superfamily